MLGAIVIAGPAIGEVECGAVANPPSGSSPQMQLQSGIPLACVELLGRSVLDRLIEELQKAGVEAITMLADTSLAGARPEIDRATDQLPVLWIEDAWCGAAQVLTSYRESGVKETFVIRLGAYTEIDLADALQFHREQKQGLTKTADENGTLDFWIVDSDRSSESDQLVDLLKNESTSLYTVRGYVNRLESPQDLRRLVVDSFNLHCHLRPAGSETRPGVWMGDGAQVHKAARIVAPAFIGRGTRIEEQCLITRCSNVESNCCIDYGTVIEDSAILSNNYVGIGLDIAHSIVNGNHLMNLERGVSLEIMDPGVIRPNRVLRKESVSFSQAAFAPAGVILAAVEENN